MVDILHTVPSTSRYRTVRAPGACLGTRMLIRATAILAPLSSARTMTPRQEPRPSARDSRPSSWLRRHPRACARGARRVDGRQRLQSIRIRSRPVDPFSSPCFVARLCPNASGGIRVFRGSALHDVMIRECGRSTGPQSRLALEHRPPSRQGSRRQLQDHVLNVEPSIPLAPFHRVHTLGGPANSDIGAACAVLRQRGRLDAGTARHGCSASCGLLEVLRLAD